MTIIDNKTIIHSQDRDLGYNIMIDNEEVHLVNNDTLSVEFWYPSLPGNVKYIEVGLSAVRAADSIRISYDFDRDGYSIQQGSKFSWDVDDPKCGDPDWQEVAFVEAWQRDEDNK